MRVPDMYHQKIFINSNSMLFIYLVWFCLCGSRVLQQRNAPNGKTDRQQTLKKRIERASGSINITQDSSCCRNPKALAKLSDVITAKSLEYFSDADPIDRSIRDYKIEEIRETFGEVFRDLKDVPARADDLIKSVHKKLQAVSSLSARSTDRG
jgi:hypothetical protein